MRKFTLLIASLFITIGAMAQTNSYTRIAEFEAARTNSTVYALKATRSPLYFNTEHNELAGYWTSSTQDLQGSVADATLTAQQFAFLRTDNTEESKYYMYSIEGSCFITSAGAKSETPGVYAYFADVTDKDDSSHQGLKLYLGTSGDNVVNVTYWSSNTAGGVRYNTNTEADAGNVYELIACDQTVDLSAAITLIEEYEANYVPTVTIDDPNAFVSGRVYTFQSQRGWLMAKDGVDYVYSSGKSGSGVTTPSTDNAYCQWVYYATETGKYLYNVGVNKFISYNSSNLNSIPLAAAPSTGALQFKASTASGYPILIGLEGAAINHNIENNTFTYGALLWGDGWTSSSWTGDAGSAHLVTQISDAETATLEAIAAAVATFEGELGNAEVKVELETLIAQLSVYIENDLIGTALGQYSSAEYTLDDVNGMYTNAVNFNESITDETSVESIQAYIDTINEAMQTFALNMPKNGDYFRVAYDYGGTIGKQYMQGAASSVKGVQFTTATNAESIWYYYNGVLYSYTAGTCLREDGNNRGLQSVGTATTATFSASTRVSGKYNIACSSYVHANSSGTNYFSDHCSQNNCAAHDLILESVTELPVEITSAGYATFYAPVAVIVQTGVTAHAVTINGDYATLGEALTTIPANTGVVLSGGIIDNEPTPATAGTYYFTITTSAETVTSALSGTVAAANATEDVYVLANGANGVGLYLADRESTFVLNSHKAYLVLDEGTAASSNGFRFDFSDGTTTEIDEVKTENGNVKTVYDLQGRIVENPAAGIYIVNGKKVLVK